MRVCLGMLARSDRAAEPLLDRVLEIVGPSFDGIEIVYDEGHHIADYAAARNRVIARAESADYDWMFMLDSDECMFPRDIATVRTLMARGQRLIILPRHEFVCDFDHYDPTGYPDYQARVFRLGVGYRYRRRVHEGLFRRFSPVSDLRLRRGLISETTPIYHYGRLKTAAVMALKMHNYERIGRGEPPLDQLPQGYPMANDDAFWTECVPFEGPHPLEGFGRVAGT
jgi:hypothetical protein